MKSQEQIETLRHQNDINAQRLGTTAGVKDKLRIKLHKKSKALRNREKENDELKKNIKLLKKFIFAIQYF